MKNTLILLIILISNIGISQNKVELRDLTFSVPSEFYYFAEQDRKYDLEIFHEIGKIFIDSIDLDKLPKIQYQYYEMPEFGLDSSEKVLVSLNEIMTKDFNSDTLIIQKNKNYSLAKYSIMDMTLFELKSLGKRGWINLQYFDQPINDTKNFKVLKEIIHSIRHNENYESDYERKMIESGESSKRALIFLGIGLAIFIGHKLIKKYAP